MNVQDVEKLLMHYIKGYAFKLYLIWFEFLFVPSVISCLNLLTSSALHFCGSESQTLYCHTSLYICHILIFMNESHYYTHSLSRMYMNIPLICHIVNFEFTGWV